MTSEEKRELERLQKPIYNSVRQAAEVHRQVGLHNACNLEINIFSAIGCNLLNCRAILQYLVGAEIHPKHCETRDADD